nr:helix-turn-helix domain-containing protein [Chitinophagales bacterium]
GIEERLLSRFKWGLTADMKVPDFETRIAILESKMAADCIEMPRNVIEYVAHNINTNVRELEGALISLLAHSTLQRRDIDLQLAKTIIRDFINNVSHQISIEEIQKLVSDYFRLPVDTLKAKTRKREVVQARQISMYLAKKFTDLSLKMIGQHFGGRDHTTVIHACQSVLNLMDIDKTFQDDVLELQKQIDFAA